MNVLRLSQRRQGSAKITKLLPQPQYDMASTDVSSQPHYDMASGPDEPRVHAEHAEHTEHTDQPQPELFVPSSRTATRQVVISKENAYSMPQDAQQPLLRTGTFSLVYDDPDPPVKYPPKPPRETPLQFYEDPAVAPTDNHVE